MSKLLCSTGALIGRPNGRNYRLLTACAEQLACDGYEFMMYDTWYECIPDIRDYLGELSLFIPVVHCDKQVGELISRNAPGDVAEAYRLFEINCDLAAALGADRLVLHLWGGIPSDRDMAHTLSCYPSLLTIAEAHGLLLTVENVVCNHADPMTHLYALAEAYPTVSFTFDTKMAAFHSQLETLYAPENARLFPHIRHMHINDYGGGYKDWSHLETLHIGEGHIDFARFFAYIKEKDYRGDFTVEATSFDAAGGIDLNAMNETCRRVRQYVS